MAHFPSTFHPLILASIDVSWLNNYSLIAAKWRSSSIIFPHVLVGSLLYGKAFSPPCLLFHRSLFYSMGCHIFCHCLDAQIVSDLARGRPEPWLLYPPDVFPACFEHLLAFCTAPPAPHGSGSSFAFPALALFFQEAPIPSVENGI